MNETSGDKKTRRKNVRGERRYSKTKKEEENKQWRTIGVLAIRHAENQAPKIEGWDQQKVTQADTERSVFNVLCDLGRVSVTALIAGFKSTSVEGAGKPES